MQALCIKKHEVDICVIGGGLSGCFAAIEAARVGARVLLMQDLPCLEEMHPLRSECG